MSRKNSDVEKLETHHVEAGDIARRVEWDGSAGFDEETERRLTKSILRKLDTRMLPMLAILFLFSFLDRTNIGNAKVCLKDIIDAGGESQLLITRFWACKPT